MRTKWHTFWSLSPQDRWLAAQSLVLLLFSVVSLRILGFKKLQVALAALSRKNETSRQEFGGDPLQTARTYARIVAIVARNLPCSVTCLPRSIVLWWLLKRSGVSSELQIGVRKEDGNLTAHAWIECFGTVVADHNDVRERFATFERAVFPASVGLSP